MMTRPSRLIAWSLIAAGVVLTFTSAVVPHFNGSYRLDTAVLFAGLAPYLVYGICVPFLRGTLLTVPGLLLVAAHGWLVLAQRFARAADYSDGWIYYGPLLLAAAALPLAVRALREPYAAGQDVPPPPPPVT